MNVPTALERIFTRFFQKREPIAGERWILKGRDDPWPDRGTQPVRILDVKNGWVRYDMGLLFRDERMKMGSFLYCYRFHSDA